MKRNQVFAALLALVFCGGLVVGCSSDQAAPPEPSTSTSAATRAGIASSRSVMTFDVDGTRRTATVVTPVDPLHPAPLVLLFHGHGGKGASIERRFAISTLWPDAIVVAPDGLPGHHGITDPEGVKPGWQTRVGELDDRDLAFYDAMFAELQSRLLVDHDRVYLVGHSNGSAFVSLLLNHRGDRIAATANLSAQPSASLLATDPTRSMFMAMGTRDPIVPYANQQQSIPVAEDKLGVDPARTERDGFLRIEHGRGNLELETYVYPGGHTPPPEVPGLVVDFFQRHTLSDG